MDLVALSTHMVQEKIVSVKSENSFKRTFKKKRERKDGFVLAI